MLLLLLPRPVHSGGHPLGSTPGVPAVGLANSGVPGHGDIDLPLPECDGVAIVAAAIVADVAVGDGGVPLVGQ